MQQSDLFRHSFSTDAEPVTGTLGLSDLDIAYHADFLPEQIASRLFDKLQATLDWKQESITIYGKTHKSPRLQAWYGDLDASYTYSGLEMIPLPWTEALLWLKTQCEAHCNIGFNSVLANLYRDGQDAMGMHSDDEKELGEQPVIASVSLGVQRNFDFKHKVTGAKYRLPLSHGSLLVMKGNTQKHWNHGIARSKKITSPRINLTFRQIKITDRGL
ncbi:MAG: alpha-ketoglutarate-dependent dioxygenase AlkB [Alteromonadaceae bacterium]|nr:alpha-ketoglutarate-dependent dioxygenase AlkB [Alteromonadaceae bacterium]